MNKESVLQKKKRPGTITILTLIRLDFLTPFKFQEELMSFQYNLIQFSTNLFKVC